MTLVLLAPLRLAFFALLPAASFLFLLGDFFSLTSPSESEEEEELPVELDRLPEDEVDEEELLESDAEEESVVELLLDVDDELELPALLCLFRLSFTLTGFFLLLAAALLLPPPPPAPDLPMLLAVLCESSCSSCLASSRWSICNFRSRASSSSCSRDFSQSPLPPPAVESLDLEAW